MTRRLNALDRAPQVEPISREEWRRWLVRNHATATGVWLVSPRRGRELSYEAAVEEALCFGWIDGQAASVDEQRSKQYFAPRRARSMWSAPNKARFERMLEAGQMTAAGLAAVERARADGSWTFLEPVDRLDLPADLRLALESQPLAQRNWDALPPSARRQSLAWILSARREDTRARRIEETTRRAQLGERPR